MSIHKKTNAQATIKKKIKNLFSYIIHTTIQSEPCCGGSTATVAVYIFVIEEHKIRSHVTSSLYLHDLRWHHTEIAWIQQLLKCHKDLQNYLFVWCQMTSSDITSEIHSMEQQSTAILIVYFTPTVMYNMHIIAWYVSNMNYGVLLTLYTNRISTRPTSILWASDKNWLFSAYVQ